MDREAYVAPERFTRRGQQDSHHKKRPPLCYLKTGVFPFDRQEIAIDARNKRKETSAKTFALRTGLSAVCLFNVQ